MRLLLEGDTTGADKAMVQAAREGREAIVRLLLEKGAELESKVKYSGRTALSYVAQMGHEALVKLLLEKGIEVESKDNNSVTPLS